MKYLFLLVLGFGLVGCTTVYVGSQNSGAGAAPEVPRVVRVETVQSRPVVVETQPVVLETQPVVLETQVVERRVQPVQLCRVQGVVQACPAPAQPASTCAAHPAHAAQPVQQVETPACTCAGHAPANGPVQLAPQPDVVQTVKTRE